MLGPCLGAAIAIASIIEARKKLYPKSNKEKYIMPTNGSQISDLMDQYNEMFDKLYNAPILPEIYENTNNCSHEWVDYYGLIDAFQYCTKCDEKRELKNG